MEQDDDTSSTRAPEADGEPERAAVEAERDRATEISRMVRTAHLDPGFAELLIENGTSVEAARSAVFRELQRRDPDVPCAASRAGDPLFEAGGDDFRAAAVDALLLRAGITSARTHPGARDVDSSILGIARTCVSRAGRTVRRGSAELTLRAAMTTSDFPLILGNALNKSIRRGYELEPASHRAWVRVVPVRDFKAQQRPILGSAPALLDVGEHGEYTHGPMDEDLASYAVSKFGRIVAVTWEVLVNDDLDAFLRVQPALGQAARRKEADLVYAIFTANAGAGQTMQDAVSLFHANHGNITAQFADLDAIALGAAREKMRMQQALGGGYLSLLPRFLIVAPAEEQRAEALLAASSRVRFGTQDEGTDAERPAWLSSLDLVVEPRLVGLNASYLAAGNDQIDTVELGLLEGNEEGPFIERKDEFTIDMTAWKVRHVAAAKALDWRGLVKIDLSA
jgi:hypothetical protein